MQNLLDGLKKLLATDERLVSEKELLKNKIVELAVKLDPELIKLLLSDQLIKSNFFAEVAGALIFDKDKFIKFISSKNFLPDSYTAFKNNIGLTENNEYISEKKEVVLSWPYKDCVLEGGQTKEDAKRDEIFWNQTLAPDEISRLLDLKVFTNAKRIDKTDEHKLDGFKVDESGNIKDNLIIKGNNLLALHSLKSRFAGKVKLIYIDPPYNTGNDSFGYNDSFNHSTWLTFMKNRLEIAKDLLSQDGSIFIQLDHNEVHYAKVLMDEIFGRENFRNHIIWCYTGPSGSDKFFPRKHDDILFYSKTDQYIFNQPRIQHKSGVHNTGQVFGDTSTKSGFKEEVEEKGKKLEDWWIDIFSTDRKRDEIVNLNGQKPEALIERIISAATNEGDLVLDFFSGSGTTGVVAHKIKRQYILIEQINDQIGKMIVRLDETIKGKLIGISKEVGWKGGGEFVYLELAKWNENFAEKIKKTKTTKELAKIWQEMRQKAFLSYQVDPKTIDEKVKEFTELSLTDQKRFLLECLDKNQIYINYSEIDDEDYGVSKDDKKLNKEFYFWNKT